MALELGVFLGAKRFGNASQGSKTCLVLDSDRHRFRQFLSDLAGQDVHAHNGQLGVLIREVAGWLRDQSRDLKVPGGRKIATEFEAFEKALPAICAQRDLEADELTFGDLIDLIVEYLAATA